MTTRQYSPISRSITSHDRKVCHFFLHKKKLRAENKNKEIYVIHEEEITNNITTDGDHTTTTTRLGEETYCLHVDWSNCQAVRSIVPTRIKPQPVKTRH